jgi:hypothetical protein
MSWMGSGDGRCWASDAMLSQVQNADDAEWSIYPNQPRGRDSPTNASMSLVPLSDRSQCTTMCKCSTHLITCVVRGRDWANRVPEDFFRMRAPGVVSPKMRGRIEQDLIRDEKGHAYLHACMEEKQQGLYLGTCMYRSFPPHSFHVCLTAIHIVYTIQ